MAGMIEELVMEGEARGRLDTLVSLGATRRGR